MKTIAAERTQERIGLMRTIQLSEITDNIKEMCIEANHVPDA